MILDFVRKHNEKKAARNYAEIIKKVTHYVKETTLISGGYLISDEQAERTAIKYFKESKQVGNINKMNQLIRRGA